MYCVPGRITPQLCPQGTFLPTTNADELDDCIPCTPGQYCASDGLPDVSGSCAAGYFCKTGAIQINPPALGVYCVQIDCVETIDGSGATVRTCATTIGCVEPGASDPTTDWDFGPCPKGHYCPVGTAYPLRCPVGTYRDVTGGATEATDCYPCDAGYYGEETAMIINTCSGKCRPGFYCDSGEFTHSPPSKKCNKGNYCVEGSSIEQPCSAGTYQPNDYAYECIQCPKGYYCDEGAILPTICGAGHRCPAGTAGTTTVPGIACNPGQW